jgi:hypothetical protein
VSHQCLVCAYKHMPLPPIPYNICPCCGVEYGLDDAFDSHAELRNRWLEAGAKWFSDPRLYPMPSGWNAWDQLDESNYQYAVPRPEVLAAEAVRVQIGSASVLVSVTVSLLKNALCVSGEPASTARAVEYSPV